MLPKPLTRSDGAQLAADGRIAERLVEVKDAAEVIEGVLVALGQDPQVDQREDHPTEVLGPVKIPRLENVPGQQAVLTNREIAKTSTELSAADMTVIAFTRDVNALDGELQAIAEELERGGRVWTGERLKASEIFVQ